MARFNYGWNLNGILFDKVTKASALEGISKSELANRALAEVLPIFPEAVAFRLSQQVQPESGRKAVTYTLEMSLIEQVKKMSEQTGISSDAIVKLVLDYYLYRLSSN